MAKIRAIGYWQEAGSPQLPDPHDLVDEDWSDEERDLVGQYLSGGFCSGVAMGPSTCRICKEPNGNREMTDFAYNWPEGLAHYVWDHGVRLPSEFVDHAMRRMNQTEEAMDLDEGWWLAASNPVR